MKTYNFYAGPAILPQTVIQQSSEALINFKNTGLSIMELSHRSKEVSEVFEEAEALVYDLLSIDQEKYMALFLSGGASSQFYMTAMNLLNEDEEAGYLDTGSWSSKAIKEAKLFGKINVCASSKDQNFNYIPKEYDIPSHLKYLHYTSNNTIFGTEYHKLPNTDLPLVSDMSSNIFSRPIQIDRHDIIYAGAQKNIGPAGVTLVIVKREALGKVKRVIPTMIDYNTHIAKKSTFNTPPVFPIYVSMLTMKWLKANGGLSEMEKTNIEKANALYTEIDRNPLFEGTARKEDRSRMNVCFLSKNEDLVDPFLNMCKEASCVGIKGHRSVGGFRASIYNAMPKESIDVLVEVMQHLERKNG